MMKVVRIGIIAFCLFSAGTGWGLSVTVNKAGSGGAFTSIQSAINSGADHITITDSGVYEENVTIGDNDTLTGGPAVTLTSTKTGVDRPVITTNDSHTYTDAQDGGRGAVVQVFAQNSKISNVIVEANPEVACGSIAVIAQGVEITNCILRPRPGKAGNLSASIPLLFCGSQGSAGGEPTSNGRNCDNVIVRDCELCGVATDKLLEPVADIYPGYLSSANSQATQLVRMDMYSHEPDGADRIIDVTFENCYIHHSSDLHLFPSNRGDTGGQVIVYLMNCRLDAAAKFSIRGRGACVVADHSVFTRTNQGNHGDGENAAIAINTQNGHLDNWARVTDCVFVNCGSAFAKKGYYGAINNHNTMGTITTDHCTFDKCLNGCVVGTGGGTTDTRHIVSNSIFHNIGYNAPPAIDAAGIPLGATTPLDPPGLYRAWFFGVETMFDGSALWSAVFNNYISTEAILQVDTCLVGTIADEDTRVWADAVAAGFGDRENILGCRLSCGDVGEDLRVRGLGTVTRGTPVFLNTDPDAEAPYQLAPGSPGQGLGARFGGPPSSAVNWSLYN
ncbi:MAG: hypothetical protein H3C63_00320 [Candidatus Omnitrophica bacterium]|nr:hypothetical protein [Candidatus Omnitrophota bacterium]